jgi:FF domain/WW domain
MVLRALLLGSFLGSRHRFTRRSESFRPIGDWAAPAARTSASNFLTYWYKYYIDVRSPGSMLRSTYKAAVPVKAKEEEFLLPSGWTEHKAPTGHSYFYNAATKQSTYTRPTAPPPTPFFTGTTSTSSPLNYGRDLNGHGSAQPYSPDHGRSFRGGLSYQDRSQRQLQQDRPKKKKAIPGCEPWILVTTKLGRRFVYDPDKNESFWKFPQNVLLATFEMDRKEHEAEGILDRDSVRAEATAERPPDATAARPNDTQNQPREDDSESYEEVEVTDDENADAGTLANGEGPAQKRRTDSNPQGEAPGPVEFDEEDIAYQLAQMGQDYGLDPGEYGNDEDEDYDSGLPLSLEDSQALFRDLLLDYSINPYTTWEKIIDEGRIIDDERYVALPNMRARKEAFTVWSTEQIQKLKEKRAKEEKTDPRIPYLRFLHEHATPKLYWPEFKRKYRKEDAMRSAQLADKDREKMYRDHINRLKLPESTRKTDLKDLLKSIPLHDLHRDSTISSLPSTILTDLRFISLPPRSRDPLVEAYIATLPSLQPMQVGSTPPTSAGQQAEAENREKCQRALRDREKMVQDEKRKVMGKMREGRAVMREEEREIEEALRIKGREGLRGYMEGTEVEER